MSTKRISFPTAYALWSAGVRGKAEYAFRFHTTDKPHSSTASPVAVQPATLKTLHIDGKVFQEVAPPGHAQSEYWDGNQRTITFATTKQQEFNKSDRFYSPTNDAVAPAYDLTELVALLPSRERNSVKATANVEHVATRVLTLHNEKRQADFIKAMTGKAK